MKLHPAGWTAWLVAVTAYAFTTGNPLYLLVLAAVVVIVHLSAEPSESDGAVRSFLVLGVGLLFVRLLFVGLLPNPGSTELFSTPQIGLPQWLGGLQLGGPISAEVLAAGFTEGLRLTVVLLAFAVFNERVDTADLIRAVPAGLRDIGLTVSIAAAFVPGTLRTAREISEAQRMRGERRSRLALVRMAVPVLAITIERAFLLAESMDSRGFGSLTAPRRHPTAMIVALCLQTTALAAWVAGARTTAGLLAMGGSVALLLALRDRSGHTTRLRRARPGRIDMIVAGASAVAVSVGVLTAIGWDAYPVVQMPPFTFAGIAPLALFAAPSAVDLLRQRARA